jgi:hypothetical protein
MCRAHPSGGIETKIVKSGDLTEIINRAKFYFDRSRGFSFTGKTLRESSFIGTVAVSYFTPQLIEEVTHVIVTVLSRQEIEKMFRHRCSEYRKLHNVISHCKKATVTN